MEPEKDQSTGAGETLRDFLRRRRGRRFNLRMTPMIDVIFLLLIFFILTAKFRIPEQFLDAFLPQEGSGQGGAAVIEPLLVHISSTDGGCLVEIGTAEKVVIHDEARDEGIAAFANSLVEVLAVQKRAASDPIEIECEDDVEWDYLVKIYNVLNALGAEDITFDMPAVEAEDWNQ